MTRATVKRVAGKVRLTLRARDASKIAATYVFVSGKRRAYKQPLVIAASKLKKITFGSVDIWGNAESGPEGLAVVVMGLGLGLLRLAA